MEDGLSPSCLFPDAVMQKLVWCFARLASHGHLAGFCRMLELAVVTLDCGEIPSVGLKHFDNLLYFVTFHRWAVLLPDITKVVIFLYLTKFYCGKFSPQFNKTPPPLMDEGVDDGLDTPDMICRLYRTVCGGCTHGRGDCRFRCWGSFAVWRYLYEKGVRLSMSSNYPGNRRKSRVT